MKNATFLIVLTLIGINLIVSCENDEATIQVPTTGMVTHYTFNDNFSDLSGNDLDPENNGVEIVSTISGNNFTYFIDSAYLKVATDDLLNFWTNNFSISLWVKSDSLNTQMVFIKGGNGGSNDAQYWLRLNDTQGSILFTTANGSSTVQVSCFDCIVTDGSWHHIVVLRENESNLIYIDNALVAEETATPLDVDVEQDLHIGIQYYKGDFINPFMGNIDEMRIYNRALTETEIELLSVRE